MLITETTIDLPAEKEVEEALGVVFSHAEHCGPETFARYIKPTDPDCPNLRGADYIYYEFEELTQFVKNFDAIRFQTKENDQTRKLRLMLVTYLQVVEADFPLTLIWNLLRLLHGDDPCWAFRIQGKNGKPETLQYSWKKLRELCKLSHNLKLPIGSIMSRMYNELLRNAIAHSAFAIRNDGQLLHLTKDYSPMSRNQRKDYFKDNKAVCVTYTFGAIDKLYKTTMNYWNNLHDHFVSLWHWTKVE